MAFILFASIWVPMAVSLVVLMSFVLRIASKAAATSLLMLVLPVPIGKILISAWIVWLLLLPFNIKYFYTLLDNLFVFSMETENCVTDTCRYVIAKSASLIRDDK